MQETQESQVQSLGQKDPLEKEMATHSSIVAWRIPWTEKLPGLVCYSPWGWRVRHNLGIKWQWQSMVLYPHIQPTTDYVVLYIFIGKKVHISRPSHFKLLLLFLGPLYIHTIIAFDSHPSHPTACSFPPQSSYLEGSPPVSSYTQTGNS